MFIVCFFSSLLRDIKGTTSWYTHCFIRWAYQSINSLFKILELSLCEKWCRVFFTLGTNLKQCHEKMRSQPSNIHLSTNIYRSKLRCPHVIRKKNHVEFSVLSRFITYLQIHICQYKQIRTAQSCKVLQSDSLGGIDRTTFSRETIDNRTPSDRGTDRTSFLWPHPPSCTFVKGDNWFNGQIIIVVTNLLFETISHYSFQTHSICMTFVIK